MADYTPITDFSAKDALVPGDPLKIVRGAYFDDEFDAIKTATDTKYDKTNRATDEAAEEGTDNETLMTPKTERAGMDFYVRGTNGIAVEFGKVSYSFDETATGTDIDEDNDLVVVYDDAAGKSVDYTVKAIVDEAGVDDLVPNTRTVSAGAGLLGGGVLTADRNFTLDPASLRNVEHSTVTLTAGTGLSGGGSIDAAVGIDLDISGLATGTPIDTSLILFQENDPSLITLENFRGDLEATAPGETGTVIPASEEEFRDTTTDFDLRVLTKGVFNAEAAAKGGVELPGGIVVNWGFDTVPASGTLTPTYAYEVDGSGTVWFASQANSTGTGDGAVGATGNNSSSILLKNGYNIDQEVYWWMIGTPFQGVTFTTLLEQSLFTSMTVDNDGLGWTKGLTGWTNGAVRDPDFERAASAGGKWCFEFVVDQTYSASDSVMLGFWKPGSRNGNLNLGELGLDCWPLTQNGLTYRNEVTVSKPGSGFENATDYVLVMLDLDLGTMSCKVNNGSVVELFNNVDIGPSDVYVPVFAAFSNGGRVSFDGTGIAVSTLPAGYSWWDG